MTVRHSFASSARLLPIKFLFILVQVILLVICLLERENHIYFDVGENFGKTSDEYLAAEQQMLGVGGAMIGLCGLEFLLMLVGTSVPPIFAKFNLL